MNLFGLSVGIGAPFEVVLSDEELDLVLGVTDGEEEEDLEPLGDFGLCTCFGSSTDWPEN